MDAKTTPELTLCGCLDFLVNVVLIFALATVGSMAIIVAIDDHKRIDALEAQVKEMKGE